MTSDSNNEKVSPQRRMDNLLMKIGSDLINLKEDLDQCGNMNPNTLSDMHNSLGELIWMAGAIEATQILASGEKPLVEVVH